MTAHARLTLAVAALLLLGAGSSNAVEEAAAANPFGRKYPARVYRTARLLGRPPTIDGRLDDEAWKQGQWAGGYRQQIPTEGADPSQPTELKILYDDHNLYFAIRVHDDPAKVHRYPGRRDSFTGDIVGICFDSYNQKKHGFEFDLTAGGSKIDLLLGNGETEWDTSWDAVWDGEVSHHDAGWNAEFRIPLSQLRYAPKEEQVWGMHAWRWIDRNQEESQWQLIPRQNTGRMYQLGELHGIRGLPAARHLELLPHALARGRSGPASSAGRSSGDAGLDLKLGLTSNFTLDATINPDFGQVEADPSVVNLTAYETFYEEKRPFFLEGKSILSFGLEGEDQLFYTRRIGHAPFLAPSAAEGETVRVPESTTILGALKVTGKTSGGLSLGVVQSLTQKETAHLDSHLRARAFPVEPFSSYTVARLHKDWDQGNTSLGGMVTSTHRSISDPGLAVLPQDALTAGVDFSRYFADRSFVFAASGVLSRVTGSAESIRALERSPVHYYQRPGAPHLGVRKGATSLAGHGGSLSLGRSETGRLRARDTFYWYSPGLELNDLGYLREADRRANRATVGWNEPTPRGPFRSYALELLRGDHWDMGGLHTRSTTALSGSGVFRNKWTASFGVGLNGIVDTRALRGGPALRGSDYGEVSLSLATDPSRRVSVSGDAYRKKATEGGSGSWTFGTRLSVRPSNRLTLQARAAFLRSTEDLQYVASAEANGSDRFVLGRVGFDTWDFTLRADLALTPDLTIQYYGSPFIGTGVYSGLRQATDTLADAYEDRFHRYGPEEITYRPATNDYLVAERATGARYAFANPDFSFRQFRSNLVVRWEYRPGSSLYVVWSEGRTSTVLTGHGSFGGNWSGLWRTPSDDVFLVKLSYWLGSALKRSVLK
jgi:hypothetical protein